MAPISNPTPPPRVLATRPTAQNRGWCDRLERAGIASLPLPVLAIEPVQEPEARQTIKNLILNFDQYNKVIFVSQNAVRETLHWLDDYWPQLPCGIEYYGVGKKTAQCLRDGGLAAHSGKDAMDSEELLAMPQLQQVKLDKILICRGRGGRPHLATELEARGAQVTLLELYDRVLPSTAAQQLHKSDFGKNGYGEVLSAFSGESLVNLVEVLTQTAVADWQQMPVLVPGERVARQASGMGFGTVIVAANATDEAMLAALSHWLDNSQRPLNR